MDICSSFSVFPTSVQLETEMLELFWQVFQQYLVRLIVWLVHVINEDTLEVRDDYPPCTILIGEIVIVSESLSIGSELLTVRLHCGLTELLFNALLLYQHLCRGDKTVYELGVLLYHNRLFKLYNRSGILNSQYVL